VWSIIVLRVFGLCGSIMPLAWRSLADNTCMFFPFFSKRPYWPFTSRVSRVTRPPKTVASRASSYSVCAFGKVASRFR